MYESINLVFQILTKFTINPPTKLNTILSTKNTKKSNMMRMFLIDKNEYPFLNQHFE
jgi:hypothetical protein